MTENLKFKRIDDLLIILESVLVGILAGIVIVLFRKGIIFVSFCMNSLYSKMSFENLGLLFLVFILVISMGFFVGTLIKKYPVIEGSGMSQLKGNFLQKIPFLPWPELPLKFITGVLCIGSGLSVGRSGPAIQVGAYFGSIFERIGNTSYKEKICLVTTGAAAGLAAIFGTPFASVLFAIEGLHQYLTPLLLTCIMIGAFSGNFMSLLFFGNKPMFNFYNLHSFPIKYFAWLILLGVVIGVIAYLYKSCIDFFEKKVFCNFDIQYRSMFPFILLIIVYLFLPLATDGGSHLIELLILKPFSLKLLFLILIVKIVFTGLCLGSGIVGGIFTPTIACGALVGAIFAKILVLFNFIEPLYYLNFLIFGMSAFLASVVRAPMTGIFLLIELTGEFYHLNGIIIPCLVAYAIMNFLAPDSGDEILLKDILHRNNS